VVTREPDDGSISDLPWAAVFDPAINARALNAVQARGFRAARELVDRFISKAGDVDSGTGTTDSTVDQHSGGVDLDRVIDSWQGVLGQFTDAIRAAAVQPPTGPAMFDLRAENAAGQVILETAEPGAVAGEIWLHNGGADDLGKVRLRCSDLLAADGALIAAECVRFEPDVVPMPARSSRGITVEVDVSESHPGGTYRGTLLAEGHADVWLPIVLLLGERI
jgi:hypothetical protein